MPTIAVVEDQEPVRKAFKTLLNERGYRVRAYADADDAEVLFDDPPDLALIDVNLGTRMSGLELVSRLRQVFDEEVLPIIVVSGLSAEEDFLRGFAAGANDYLAKPFSTPELLAKCAHQLTRRDHLDGTPTDAMPAIAPLPGGEASAFDRYQIDGELGRGSYAVVYDAYDAVREEPVALKVLTPSALLHTETRTRFLREIVALATVRSPHLARLIDHGDAEGRHFLAMERVTGPTLQDWVTTHGPLTDEELVELLRGLGHALVALREAELVHRDIKPSNVILRDGDPSQPVLVDFGLARGALARGVTTEGILVGSPGYMAPEYVASGVVDYKSDLFSVGQVALFARQGRGPFPLLNGFELLRVMVTRATPIPDWLDPDLASLIRGLTKLEPERRIPSAQVLLAKLQVLPRRKVEVA